MYVFEAYQNTRRRTILRIRVKPYFLFLLLSCVMAFFSLSAGGVVHDNDVSGYWMVYNRQSQKHSIVYLYVKNGRLEGRGVRSFKTEDGTIPYLCHRCSGRLKNKPLWSGKYMPFKGFKRKKNSNIWYKGVAIDPKRGWVMRPTIKFYRPNYAHIDFRFFIFTASIKMKKITETEAFAGCESIKTRHQMQKYGNLEEKSNRDRLLEGLGVTAKELMKGVNNGSYCSQP